MPLINTMKRARLAAPALIVALVLGAGSEAKASESNPPVGHLEMRVSLHDLQTNIDRVGFIDYRRSESSDGWVWISRDRSGAACPERPDMQNTPGVRWVLGGPNGGDRMSEAMNRPGLWSGAGTRFKIQPQEHGWLRVCAWALVRTASDPTEQWITTGQIRRIPRVMPTSRERRALRGLARRQVARNIRAWARYGARAKMVGPKISRIDPAFALVSVVRATRADSVQGGHTIYHFSNGRWRPLEPPSQMAGDTARWCIEYSNHRVTPPVRVIRGFFGPRECR